MKSLILAGGSGTRLWPWSRTNYPKQFLKIFGQDSFLQLTIKRLLKLTEVEDLYLITHADAYSEVVAQASEIDPRLAGQVLLEPAPKNTAPAIAYALDAFIQKGVSVKEEVLVCPADHLITPDDVFCQQVQAARQFAQEGCLVTFGVRPTKPETGYGYIRAKGNQVCEFIEKPDFATAQRYLLSGDYFWNAGIFLFTIETMQREFEKYKPDFNHPVSIDQAIMEKSQCLAMIPLELTWSDIGAWDNLYEVLEKNDEGNVLQGPVHTFETTNSLVLAKKRLVATIGLKDMLVIETEDAVLVAPKAEAQKVKNVVAQLQGKSEVCDPQTSQRPWGYYTVLEEGPRFKIKKIMVRPKQALSLQMHYHRSEHWIVVRGTASVTIQDQKKFVHEGESIFVPQSAVHRVENPGKVPLEIIEVQVGEYLGEDDIIRLEDEYGRIKQEEAFKVLLGKTKR
ncbi:MAG: cupin domain-containing protein [Verrucomicrobia bacterium]|nr:cupin domain-containing protein [Verrucomicrobiota bacterium]MBS0646269.1 cupin domain-containing protein [Verrucomicrobiota bacterium]